MDDIDRVKKTFGRRVEELRKSQHLSINRLAAMCGMNNTYLGWVERGEVNISLKTQAKIASALDVEIWELFVAGDVADYVRNRLAQE